MKIDHLINGQQVAGNAYFETINPATQQVLAEVASGGEAEVHAAVAAAKAAFPKWAGTPAPERAKLIRKLGDPRELDPFTIDCAQTGTGRWVDTRNWVYDFARDLPAGVRCSFVLKEGLADIEGKGVAGGQRFAFSTGGPAIVRSLPGEGSRIDENQVFILGLDAPATAESILAHAYCVVAGVNEQIGVRLVTGKERKAILDNRKAFATSYLRLLLVDGDEGRTRGLLFRLPATGSDNDKFLRLRDAADSPLVTLACARTLPAGATTRIVWGKGIQAVTGLPTTAAQTLSFDVRPSFRASFTCDRVNKDAQCIPILPLSLSFTAPIAKSDAAKIRLVDS